MELWQEEMKLTKSCESGEREITIQEFVALQKLFYLKLVSLSSPCSLHSLQFGINRWQDSVISTIAGGMRIES